MGKDPALRKLSVYQMNRLVLMWLIFLLFCITYGKVVLLKDILLVVEEICYLLVKQLLFLITVTLVNSFNFISFILLSAS